MANANSMNDTFEGLENLMAALSNVFEHGDEAALGGPQARAAARAAINRMAAPLQNSRTVLRNEHTQRTEAITITPMTAVYVERAGYHVGTDLPGMRDYRLGDFKGDREKCSKDSYACLDWIARALAIADKHRLPHDLARNFLRLHCTNEAGRTMANAIGDEKTLTEIIIDLETNYSGLIHPDLAHEACKVLTRKDAETLRTFGERVRFMAEMVTRNITDMAIRRRTMMDLSKDTFMAALRPTLKKELNNRLDARRRLGEPKPDYTGLVAEAHRLDESRMANEKVYKNKRDNNGTIRKVSNYDDEEDYTEGEQEDDDQQDQDDDDDDGNVRAVGNYRRNDKDKRRDQRPDTKRFNRYQPRSNNFKQTYKREEKVRQMVERMEEYDEDGQNVTIYMVPTQPRRLDVRHLNVLPHECAKCGQAGHRAGGADNHKCPLKLYVTRTEPCNMCNKGGHDAAICPNTLNLERKN